MLADPRVGVAPGQDDLVHRPALGRAAAHDALDAVRRHEVHRALGAALDGLPALHREAERARDQREVREVVAAVRHLGRQRVVLALVRERLLVEGLEDDLDLLLEELAVRGLVQERRAERLHLAGVVAAAHAERHAAAGEDVGHREVLGEPERMPHRRDVEPAADAEPPRHVGEMDGVHQHVGDALVALVLEVVLGHPEGVVAPPVHELGHGLGLVEHRGEPRVAEAAVIHRRAAVAHVVHVDVAGEQAVELGDHAVAPSRVMSACSILP